MIKLISIDIDGCLNSVDDKGKRIDIDTHGFKFDEITLKGFDKIKKTIKKGKKILHILNTGRSMIRAKNIAKLLGIKYIIYEHGVGIYDVKKDIAVGFFDYAEKNDFTMKNEVLEAKELLFDVIQLRNHFKAKRPTIEKELLKKIQKYLGDSIGFPNQEVQCLIDCPTSIRKAGNKYLEIFHRIIRKHLTKNAKKLMRQGKLTVCEGPFGTNMTLILSKATGLKIFMEMKKIKKENTAAIGDEIADIKVMENVAIPCCPKNADTKLKSYVKKRKGIISKKRFSEGTIEILQRLYKRK